MAQIKKLQIDDETLYPVTIPQAVVDPDSGDTLREELDSKVDKVTGKQLSTEDYTTAEKSKVTNLPLNTSSELNLKVDKANLESARSQSTTKVPTSKLLDDELNKININSRQKQTSELTKIKLEFCGLFFDDTNTIYPATEVYDGFTFEVDALKEYHISQNAGFAFQRVLCYSDYPDNDKYLGFINIVANSFITLAETKYILICVNKATVPTTYIYTENEISSIYAKINDVLSVSDKTYSEVQKNQIRLNSLSEGSFIPAKRKEIFGFENLLTDVVKGFSTGVDFVVSAAVGQACSNYFTAKKNEIVAIQGFHPQFSYYISYFDENKQALGIGTSSPTFISFTKELTCGYYTVPNNDSIDYAAITLYRDNNIFIDGNENSTIRQFPFDINKAIISKVSDIAELPFLTTFSELVKQGIEHVVTEQTASLVEQTNNMLNSLTRITDLAIDGTLSDGFINTSGQVITTFPEYCHKTFTVEEGKVYLFSTKVNGGGFDAVNYYNTSGAHLGGQYPISSAVTIDKEEAVLPVGTVTIKVTGKDLDSNLIALYERIPELIDIQVDVESRLDNIEEVITPLSNPKTIEFTKGQSELLIRSSFDETRDMVLVYKVNQINKNFSPYSAHLGLKTQTTQQIKATAYVHTTYDSTPPILTQNYWHIFGEHGWLIPKITSTGHDKTSADVGSIWQTSLGKQFKIAKISGNDIYFFPRITTNGGGIGKDTQDYYFGDVLTDLTHVSGAVNTSNISVTVNSNHQLSPVTINIAKKYYCDGLEVTENKTYYCDELKLIDVHEGIDPKTITNFDSPSGDSLVRLTYTYIFNGLNCFISNRIEPLNPIWLSYYPAMQPLGLRSNGDYRPMIFIPKVKPVTVGETVTDWKYPQDCGDIGQSVNFQVNSDSLIDINDIPERVVQFHKKSGVEDYLIGFAAGFSLLSSSAVSSKRALLSLDALSLARDERNKYYPKVLHENAFGDIMNVGDVFNFNYYYSYFNPSIQGSKVYWYKEGNNYIVYIHSHELIASEEIVLPEFIEGKTAQIIEKTAGATLLTDTVSNKSLIVSFTDYANYLVLKL